MERRGCLQDPRRENTTRDRVRSPKPPLAMRGSNADAPAAPLAGYGKGTEVPEPTDAEAPEPETQGGPSAPSAPSAPRPQVVLQKATGKERRKERSEARAKARVESLPMPECHVPPPYRAGQSVLWFWAPWFVTAALDAAPDTLKKGARPKWFTAVITAPAASRTVVYAGQTHHGQTYDVY
jgi:hypothetical protein